MRTGVLPFFAMMLVLILLLMLSPSSRCGCRPP
jgi:hypothetical protein